MKKGKKSTVELVYEIARPIADEIDVYLWDVKFEKEGSSWFLKIILDSNEGITFEECEAMSRPLSKILDEKDFIAESYYLEVSSPGIMRELRKPDHFETCLTDEVIVKSIRPIDGQREFIGELKSFEDGVFVITSEDGDKEFKLSECSFVKLNDDINPNDYKAKL